MSAQTYYQATWYEFLLAVRGTYFGDLARPRQTKPVHDRIQHRASAELQRLDDAQNNAPGVSGDYVSNRPHVEHVARFMAFDGMTVAARRAFHANLWALLERFTPMSDAETGT